MKLLDQDPNFFESEAQAVPRPHHVVVKVAFTSLVAPARRLSTQMNAGRAAALPRSRRARRWPRWRGCPCSRPGRREPAAGDIDGYRDHYQAVEEMLAARTQGKRPTIAEKEPASGRVMDLMSALHESVQAARHSRGEATGDDASVRDLAGHPKKKTATKKTTATKKAAAKKTSRKPKSA